MSVLLIALVGCASAPIEESELSSGVVVANALTINGLSNNSVALNSLAGNGLTQNRIVLNDLVVDAPGREVMRYLVSCALRPDQEMTVTVEGVEYTFPGQLGLAPRWIDRALRKAEEGWISACMLARVNAFDVSVLVSLRAKNAALAASEQELADFPVQEAAFYGDIFTDGPIDANACVGSGQAAGEDGSLEDRDCAEEDPGNPGRTVCGFTYAGHCADFSPAAPDTYACQSYKSAIVANERDHRGTHDVDADVDDDGVSDSEEGGFYTGCHDKPGQKGKWKGSTRYRQVITVYLQP